MKWFGVAATAALLALGAPMAAYAAPAKDAPKEKPKPYEKDALAKGTKEGPAVLARASLKCTPSAFAYVSAGTQKDPETKKDNKINVWEVSCSEGLGYMLLETVGGSVKPFDCIAAIAQPNASQCKLPGNADPRTQVKPLIAAAGRTCTASDVRWVGATPAGENFYEIGCQGAEGFVLKTSTTEPKPEVTECAVAVGSSLECKFTTKEQIEAAQKAKIDRALAKSGKTCTVSASRTVGRLKGGDDLYEVACGSAGGFMLQASQDLSKVQAIECGKADQLFAGGCSLTNAAEAQVKEAATYARFAKAAGFNCAVSKYRLVGMDSTGKSELVELACSDRPDGGMGLFPTDNSKGAVYDCVAAERFGQKCRLTSASLVYPKYTQALAAKGKTTCKISNTRFVGTTKEGSDFIESACADGNPGWVIEMANTQVKGVLSCGQAKSSGLPCQLPGNTK